MAFSKEQIEYLHNTGKMPDWAYYQQNGGLAQENYNRQKLEQSQRITQKLQEKELEEIIMKKIETILEDLFSNIISAYDFMLILDRNEINEDNKKLVLERYKQYNKFVK